MTDVYRTLLFSTLFPSAARPLHGIFVETRLRALLGTGRVQTRVVAPVPWFPSTAERWGGYAQMARTPERESRNGLDVLHPRYLLLPKVGMSTAPFLLALGAVPAIRRLIAEGFDFDLIDAHYFYPDGVAAALLGRWFRRPVTVTARGSDVNLIAQRALPRRMMRRTANHIAAVIGVSQALVDAVGHWGAAPQRTVVIRNGVDLVRFRPMPQQELRAGLGIAAGPILGSVGHLVELKGHHIAIAAMTQVLARWPHARLFIVGEGPERPRLEALINTLGLAGSVSLIGAVRNEDLWRWYGAADALLLASSREGWPNVLLEAMACGTPVVATRVGGVPEIVRSTQVGELVDQREPGDLAAAVLRLLGRAPDRLAVRRYAESFGWEQTSQMQITLFEDVLRSAR